MRAVSDCLELFAGARRTSGAAGLGDRGDMATTIDTRVPRCTVVNADLRRIARLSSLHESGVQVGTIVTGVWRREIGARMSRFR